MGQSGRVSELQGCALLTLLPALFVTLHVTILKSSLLYCSHFPLFHLLPVLPARSVALRETCVESFSSTCSTLSRLQL